jgi:hypothetical protein
MDEEKKTQYKIFFENLKEKDKMEDLNVDVRIILQEVLEMTRAPTFL